MAAYAIFIREGAVTDPEAMAKYQAGNRSGAPNPDMKVHTVYGAMEQLEGEPCDGMVILEFPDMAGGARLVLQRRLSGARALPPTGRALSCDAGRGDMTPRGGLAALAALSLAGCMAAKAASSDAPVARPPSDALAQSGASLMTGGYLPRGAMPDSLLLNPPPPAPGFGSGSARHRGRQCGACLARLSALGSGSDRR